MRFKDHISFLAIISLLLLLGVSGAHTRQTAAGAQRGSDQDQTVSVRARPGPSPPAQDPPPGALSRKEVRRRGGDGEAPVVREKTEIVSLTVTVTDKNQRLIAGLAPDQFEVFDNRVKQKIEYFKEDDDPLSIGIVFDTSSSMTRKLDRAREALKAFVETSHEDDEFFLVTFNDQVHPAAGFSDSQAILRQISTVSASGRTALYDAICRGLENVTQGRHRRRAILVISDGEDNSSRCSLGALRKLIRESDVQIYCVGIPQFPLGLSGFLDAGGQATLDEIAQMTGGRAFFPNMRGELEDAVTRITLELRRQYSIGYVPNPAPNPGKWHEIKVRVHQLSGYPSLKVRAKEGYYPTP